MSGALRKRLTLRDLGQRRIRSVTVGTVAAATLTAGTVAMALAQGTALASTPTPSSNQPGTGTPQLGSSVPQGSSGIQPPAQAPAPAFGRGSHASSGAS